MSSTTTPAPDLAAILATLASFNNKNPNNATNLQPPAQSTNWTPPPQQTYPYPPPQSQHYQHPEWPLAGSATQVEQKNIIVIDPSTITEWSVGLRCLMRTVSKHDELLKEIRRMIKVQHEHEAQWWKGREELVKRQNARADGQKKLDDVLKVLGGAIPEGISNTTPEELANELTTFDMKVHRAQLQMVREMTSKLRILGIPFFGTRSDLVIPVGKGEVVEGDGGRKLEKGMVHELELCKLQRKMIGILEDMCTD